MTALADINVLLPILVADHAFHRTAWRWWESRSEASVGLCLLTRLGTLRMLCNAKVMAGRPVSPRQAMDARDALAGDPRCIWVESDGRHEEYFRLFTIARTGSPNLWTDAWLAALAAACGLRLTSFDAGFSSFNLPDFEHLKPV